jgi:hypothetical protein
MEWALITILVISLLALLRVFRNVVKTIDNIRLRILEVSEVVKEYKEYLKKLNSSESYYGDPTVEAFVKMTNDISGGLEDILDIRRELTGEENAEKEN